MIIRAIRFTKLTLLLFSQFHSSNNNTHYMFHWHNQTNRSSKWSNKSWHGLCWKDQVTLKSCVSHTGSAHLWSLIRWLAWLKIAWLRYIQYCLNIEKFSWFKKLKIAWLKYIQYCLKEMLDIENWLASKTVPRNVKDFPTLWNKIMLMFVLATIIIGVMITRTKQWSWPLIMVITTLAKLR